jgi:signal transduction histidine kinase
LRENTWQDCDGSIPLTQAEARDTRLYDHLRQGREIVDLIVDPHVAPRSNDGLPALAALNQALHLGRISPNSKESFDKLTKLLQGSLSDVVRCEVLKCILDYAVFSGMDHELTLEYIHQHRAIAYDSLELSSNEYYTLRADLNHYYYRDAGTTVDTSDFIRLIDFGHRNEFYRFSTRVSNSLATYFSYDTATLARAIYYYDQSLVFAALTDSTYRKDKAFAALSNKAQALISLGQYAAAKAGLLQVDTTATPFGKAQNRSYYYDWLAQSYEGLGQLDSALHYYRISAGELEQAKIQELAGEVRDIKEKYQNKELASSLERREYELKSRSRLLILMATLLLISIIAFLLFRKVSRQRRQSLEQSMLLERAESKNKQLEALHHERTRIAGEMHDDLGGGLTTIKFLSQKVKRKIDDDRLSRDVDKIATNATTLVNNMSEIIWAMNGGMDTLENLVAYCRRYAREYLEDYEVDLQFSAAGIDGSHPMTGEVRRNVFLVIKEALHNTIKHAEASSISIRFEQTDANGAIQITYADDGIGLPDETRINGHGLRSMRQRVESVGGTIEIAGDDGVEIRMEVG